MGILLIGHRVAVVPSVPGVASCAEDCEHFP